MYCILNELYRMNTLPKCVVFAISGFLPRNRLAVRPEPPGGTSICALFFLYFDMNCLTGMNILQAAR